MRSASAALAGRHGDVADSCSRPLNGRVSVNVAPCPTPGLSARMDTAVPRSEVTGDRQPESESAMHAGARGILLSERFEDVREKLSLDAFSRIADRDRDIGVGSRETDGHNAARRRKLRRVRQQVRDDLVQLRPIAGNRPAPLKPTFHAYLSGFGQREGILDHGIDNALQVDAIATARHLARNNPGNIEEIFYQPRLRHGIALDRLEGVP